jgi:formate-dependent nitrite reductase cytochrome c552 subunit
MDEAPLEDKAAMARAKISKVAKANSIKTWELKVRAAEGIVEIQFGDIALKSKTSKISVFLSDFLNS